jgi:Bacteriophage tail sheath protein
MPVAPTYPGVYIEEVPSGVHTITGVATSITAFVGYTARGDVNEPVHIFSFADFERAFGGLAVDSPLSYAVKQFFQNGGTDAYVVRVAQGAAAASTVMLNGIGGGASDVLQVTASSAGTWGNLLQIDVDYATSNPASLFNLTVTEFVDQNGQLVPGRVETFRNLSMNSFDPAYAVNTVNMASQLVELSRPAALAFSGNGTSISAPLTFAEVTSPPLPMGYRLAYTLNGEGPFELTVAAPSAPGGTLATALAAIAGDIQAAVNAAHSPGITGGVSGSRLQFTANTNATHPAERSSIHFFDASTNSMAGRFRLGLLNGGTERDAAAGFRPAQTGTVGAAISFPLAGTPGGLIDLRVLRGSSAVPLATIPLQLWGGPIPQPTNLDELLAQVRVALTAASATQPLLVGATAIAVNGGIRVLPGEIDPNLSFEFANSGADTTAAAINLNGAQRNFARYAPGSGVTALAQKVTGPPGNNGTAPGPNDLTGSLLAKTGIYVLENVDLFNLLVMPDATAGGGMMPVLTEAIAYCTRRRAFMIIDAPETVRTFADAQAWIGGPASPLRSRNAALYFPRLREPDPLRSNVMWTFPAAGALAGLYARTDAERGVWKAPAGTSAIIVGALGLSYTLTDSENGALNPLGLNCLRTFPVYGTISWGARTARGADALADEYKYAPVRRLALFLEESLYRGTQWVVFEPNDEPLWAQIRLNLGAFMHNLFAQGAFQGNTPRDAYFVKCDKETTTQNDIDLGRVNIVVGFAPLKPAEFVIIRIQQIAGAIQT